MLHLLPGTENARIVHYGYAIEYDFCPPIQLKTSLETKAVPALYLAGQINGTSGYEEAAALGLMAGLNAVRSLQGKEPIILRRDQAYIGVMIDDLLTKGVSGAGDDALGTLTEPYRMFTSRAEHRLMLRADNADRRLTELARSAGLIDDERWTRFEKKTRDLAGLKKYLEKNRSDGASLWDHLRRPRSTLIEQLRDDPAVKKMQIEPDVLDAAAIDAKYEGYLAKQQRLALGMQSLDSKRIPQRLDYNDISHLRAEAREKLSSFRPETLGQASRINGITPADITVIQIHLRKSVQSLRTKKPAAETEQS
jgi:tRNA uridine 5-carboxymethylaminomethyl modification enzyme